MYKGNKGSEEIVRRSVISSTRLFAHGCLPSFSVEELAKKKGVKMAQIAVAWSLKRVTAPIVGTTKIENMKEMIGKWDHVWMDFR
jgi:aryl-alcohol dehydrogenase-like predicted oxidoreductase